MYFKDGDKDDERDDPYLQHAAGDLLEKYKQAYTTFSILNRQINALEKWHDTLGGKLSAEMSEADIEEILGQMHEVRDHMISLQGSWREALRALQAIRKQVDWLLDELGRRFCATATLTSRIT
jgi:hypothetical protein